jgi:hypothetical protein
MTRRLLPVVVLCLAAGCDINKNSMTAPSTAQMTLTPQVDFIARNTSAVFTAQIQSGGQPVPDGTEVVFGATLGTVDQLKVRTRGGVATATYTAGGQSGTGRVTVTSGELQAGVEFTVNRPVGRVLMSADRYELPPGGGDTTVTATVVSAENDPLEGIPVTFETSTGTITATAAIKTNAQGQAQTTLRTTSAATVRGRALTVQSEGLAISVRPPIVLSVAANPPGARVGEPITFSVGLMSGGQAASGNVTLTLGDGRVHDFGTVTGTASVQHTFAQAGGYNVTATLTTADGSSVRETIRVEIAEAPAPPPAPSPSPSPSPSPDPGPVPSGEPIDLSRVVWLHTNVSNWRVTSTITNVSIGNPPICIEHTKAGRWPTVNGLEGNPWIFANINGTWYAATYEWLKPGQTCKGISAGNIGEHIKRAPLENWRPRSGEVYGFMVSALARSGQQAVAERSNIVMVRWP